MATAIFRATWMTKTPGAKGTATLVAKNAGKCLAGAKAGAANSMKKLGLQAKTLGNTRSNQRARLHRGQKHWQQMWQGYGKNCGKDRKLDA